MLSHLISHLVWSLGKPNCFTAYRCCNPAKCELVTSQPHFVADQMKDETLDGPKKVLRQGARVLGNYMHVFRLSVMAGSLQESTTHGAVSILNRVPHEVLIWL